MFILNFRNACPGEMKGREGLPALTLKPHAHRAGPAGYAPVNRVLSVSHFEVPLLPAIVNGASSPPTEECNRVSTIKIPRTKVPGI